MKFQLLNISGALLLVLLVLDCGFCESGLRSLDVNSIETTSRRSSRLQGRASLFCYTCNSIKDGESCYNVNNETTTLAKCSNDTEAFCKVRRVEYTQTDVNEVSNASSAEVPPNRWSMERGCSNECSNFCVNVGARTKITYCTSCCNTDGCNIDNAASYITTGSLKMIIVVFSIIFNKLST